MRRIMEPVKERFQGRSLKCHLSEIMREGKGESTGGATKGKTKEDQNDKPHTSVFRG